MNTIFHNSLDSYIKNIDKLRHYELLSADDPAALTIGFVCDEVNEYHKMRLSTIKTSGNHVLRNYFSTNAGRMALLFKAYLICA